MVIGCAEEIVRLREQPSRSLELTLDKGKAIAVYKASWSKESQMRNHEKVINSDREHLEQDWRNKVQIAVTCVEFKDNHTETLSAFESIWHGLQAKLIFQGIKCRYFRLTRSRITLRRIRRVQKHESLRKNR